MAGHPGPPENGGTRLKWILIANREFTFSWAGASWTFWMMHTERFHIFSLSRAKRIIDLFGKNHLKMDFRNVPIALVCFEFEVLS